MRRLFVFFIIALLIVMMGCDVIEDDYADLWKQAYARGKNNVFLGNIDGWYQPVVWVSATADSRHIAHELAEGRGMRLLGDVDAYVIDSRYELLSWHHDYQDRVDLLMTLP